MKYLENEFRLRSTLNDSTLWREFTHCQMWMSRWVDGWMK